MCYHILYRYNTILIPLLTNLLGNVNLILKKFQIGLLDALAKGLLSDPHVTNARILGINVTNGMLTNSIWWNKQIGGLGGPHRIEEDGMTVGKKPDSKYPWYFQLI